MMVENWKTFLSFFEKALGLTINLDKSSIVGLNTPEEEVLEMADLVGCKVDHFPLIIVGGRPKNESFWDLVIDKICSKLGVWRGFPISKGG